jgi:spore coat polysaccharide biosynthesis protein SpsF
VPAIYLCLTEDHAESANVFVKADIALNLGVVQHVTEDDIAGAVRTTLQESEKLELMRNRAIRIIDGKGAERIATLVTSKL